MKRLFVLTAACGLVLAACGGSVSFGDDGTGTNSRFMTIGDLNSENSHRFLEKTSPMHFASRKYVEADEYYVIRRWALGPAFAAQHPDEGQGPNQDQHAMSHEPSLPTVAKPRKLLTAHA